MPAPVIECSGWSLRPWADSDRDELHALFDQPAVREYLFDGLPVDRETAAAVLAKGLAAPGFWNLIRDSSQAIGGFVGFFPLEDSPDVELIYGLAPPYWGQGLATAASRAALAWLWANTACRRVVGRTDPPNRKSIGVLERLAMRRAADVLGPAGQTLLEFELFRPPGGSESPQRR